MGSPRGGTHIELASQIHWQLDSKYGMRLAPRLGTNAWARPAMEYDWNHLPCWHVILRRVYLLGLTLRLEILLVGAEKGNNQHVAKSDVVTQM